VLESSSAQIGRVERDTVGIDVDAPMGLDSHVVLQRARARLLGRTETLARIGRYAVTHRIGVGGMGVVYAAHDPDLDRDVAIKVLRKEVDDDPVRQSWLLREAQALAKLNHPNVVHVYEVGKYDGHVFLAMELVEGRTLRAWVKAEQPRWREIVGQYIEAGHGLAAAHRAGVIHRDFKPDNVLVGHDGRVRVLDFGLAGLEAATNATESMTAGSALGVSTAPGGVSGTPSYMAPEQHAASDLSPATDQFAFCVSLWEALVGAAPYAGDNARELAERKQAGPPAWPKYAECARAVVDALRRGLAPEPALRWRSMDALLRALQDALSHRLRNRIAFASAGLVLVACSTALASWGDESQSICTGAQDQLGAAWNAEQREATRLAFAATELAYAERAWQRTAPVLDAYATEWVAQHTDACEATRMRGEQSVELMDARIACLHGARRALAATTDRLVRADDAVVERADDLVASLPVLARCGDLPSLLDRVAPPPIDVAAEVESIRAMVAIATSFERIGKYDDADAALAPAIERAAATGYDPVATEVDLLLGTIRERQGRYAEAEAAHAAALQTGLRAGQWDEATRASTSLVMTLGSFQREAARGLDFVPTARGLLGRSSNPQRAEAELRRVLGNVYRGKGDLARAEEELRAALALTLEAPGTDAIDVSMIRLALGSVLETRGDLDRARAELDAAVEIRTEYLGADHPRTANARHNLAALLAKRGDMAGAEREYRAALAVLVRAHGPRHPSVAMARSNLAGVLDETGRAPAAEAEKREVLEIFAETHGPDHPHVASARQNLAVTLGRQGKHAEAVAELRKVIDALEAKLGPRHPTIATVRLNLGMELGDLGELEASADELRVGVEMRLEALGETSIEVAEARTELARALVKLGRIDEALGLARASWSTYAQGDGPPQRRAASAFVVARALHAKGGHAAEARRFAETARDLLAPGDETRTAIEAWLADRGARSRG